MQSLVEKFKVRLHSEVTPEQARIVKNVAMVVNATVSGVLAAKLMLNDGIHPLMLIVALAVECVSFATYGAMRHIQGLHGVPLREGR